MNGPRRSLESQTIQLDHDIWSPADISPDSQANELRAAARRLRERLLLCGCLEDGDNGNWVRLSARKNQF